MKIFCVGRNYVQHAKELGNPIPDKPVIFMKPETALLKDNLNFYCPDFTNELNYEAELAVRISKVGKNISPKFANRYYNQITVGIDFTARDIQRELKQKGYPWEISKAFDNSAAIGEWVEIADKDINNINFSLSINDKIVQKGNSSEMLFKIDDIISYISKFFTLKTGDIIFTGTPAGVGLVNKNEHFRARLENQEVLHIRTK